MFIYLQNGDDPSYSDSDRQLEQRANWAKERLSLQLQLNRAEQEVEQLQADLRIERERRSALGAVTNGATSDTDKDKVSQVTAEIFLYTCTFFYSPVSINRTFYS